MNKISITGRVGADAELRHTPAGDAVCTFRMASDVGYGKRKTTNWFSCEVWGKRGEGIAPLLQKGQQVTVFGSLSLRKWTNQAGVEQLSPDVRVDEIELQGGKREGGEAQATASYQPEPARAAGFLDEEIPFNQIDWRTV